MGAEVLVDVEDGCYFIDGFGSIFAEVVECDVDDVGGLDVLQHVFLCGLAQSSGFLRQLVELFAGGACVHLLEGFVQFQYPLGGHTGELACFRHLFLHISVWLNRGDERAVGGGDPSGEGSERIERVLDLFREG